MPDALICNWFVVDYIGHDTAKKMGKVRTNIIVFGILGVCLIAFFALHQGPSRVVVKTRAGEASFKDTTQPQRSGAIIAVSKSGGMAIANDFTGKGMIIDLHSSLCVNLVGWQPRTHPVCSTVRRAGNWPKSDKNRC